MLIVFLINMTSALPALHSDDLLQTKFRVARLALFGKRRGHRSNNYASRNINIAPAVTLAIFTGNVTAGANILTQHCSGDSVQSYLDLADCGRENDLHETADRRDQQSADNWKTISTKQTYGEISLPMRNAQCPDYSVQSMLGLAAALRGINN